MPSNLEQLDEGFIQYPVPGIDNDSQGFRDRFNIIRNNINIAKTELDQLIDTSAKLDQDNNFAGGTIVNANLNTVTLETNTANATTPVINNVLNLPWPSGHVHVVRVGTSPDPLTLNFTNWPTEEDRFAQMKVILFADGSFTPEGGPNAPARTINFQSLGVSSGIKRLGDFTLGIQDPTRHVMLEVSTYDSGGTAYVSLIGTFT